MSGRRARRARAAQSWPERLRRSWEVLLDLMDTLGGGGGSAYRGGQVDRTHPGGRAGLRAADQEILADMRMLRGRARDVRRNNPYVQQYLNLEMTNVLGGPGLPDHQALVRRADGELDEDVNDTIEEGFRDYAGEAVTVDGRMNLDQFRRLQLETWRVDGEAFTRLVRGAQFRHGLALQAIDPDLVDDRLNREAGSGLAEIRMGVEVDENGRPIAYHAWSHPEYGPGAARRRLIRYEAVRLVDGVYVGEILHHYRPRRANQTRGVSEMAAVILDLMDIDGLDEAVIVGARAAARQIATVYWQDAALGAPPDPNDPDSGKPSSYNLDDSQVLELNPGQRMEPFVPQQPTSVYPPFVKTRVRRIGCGLGVAYASLSNDLEAVNYGSMRGGALIERDVWGMKQGDWNASFERPLHRAWLEMALLTGALSLASRDWRRYSAVEIVSRGWDWVDPRNDAETAQIELGLALTSRTRIHRKRGSQYRQVLRELAREKDDADAAGVDIEPRASAAPAASAKPADPPEPKPEGEEDAEGRAAANGHALPGGRIAALARARAR